MKNLIQNCSKKLSLNHSLKRIPALFVTFIFLVLSGCEKRSQHLPETKAEDIYLKSSSVKTSAAGDVYFKIAVVPDTQCYTGETHGGTVAMFQQQIAWIRANKDSSNIAYVVHLGDIVAHGDTAAVEWTRSKDEMYKLETDNIPYGTAVGNHDQTPRGCPINSTDNGYGVWFGRDHMSTKSWYGGAYGSGNKSDNHYDLFTANSVGYIVLYIEFNSPSEEYYDQDLETAVINWADQVLNNHSGRKAIIVSHSILFKPAGSNSDIKDGEGNNDVASAFTSQGNVIYNRMKLHSNVFLMLCGHNGGEGFREDTYNGNVIKSYLTDYQARQNPPYTSTDDKNGGNGTMRMMKFNKTTQKLSVTTFALGSDGVKVNEIDGDSQFTKPLYN